MRNLFVIIICFVLVGCSGEPSPSGRVVSDAPFIKRTSEEKSIVTKQFFTNGSLQPIATTDDQDFYSINEWYDEDTIIYSVGENGLTSLYLHNIYTGERALFYQTEEFISKIQANANQTLFAIHTLEKSGISNLRVLNKIGNEVFSRSNKVEEFQFIWNPYTSDELVVTEFLSYLEFQLLKVKINTKEVNNIPITNPFVQWISKDEIGYLNWNQNEPSLEAPVVIFNIHTHDEKIWRENCVLFFTLNDVMMTVSVNKDHLDKSIYTFFDAKNRKKITEISIPNLNTFSEAWWIPSFDYDHDKKLFYYMKPNRAGDITEYNAGYQLSIYSLNQKKEKVLATFSDNVPIKLSPDGTWCLIGQQFEQIINISNNKISNLVSD